MKAVIKHNGQVIPDAMCSVNTAGNIVVLNRMYEPSMELNLDRVYVEVNLFGELEALEDDEE